MKNFKNKMLTRADKWLIIILLIAAAAGVLMSKSLFTGGGQYVQISVNGKVVKTISLQKGYYGKVYIGDNSKNKGNNKEESKLVRNGIEGYNIHGYNVIEINSDKVAVKEADCPDQICVKTGWASAASRQIVCLPNRVVVKVISDNGPDQVDDIAR